MHKHQWQIVARTYVPPNTEIKHMRNGSEGLVERLLSGVTTIIWECQTCGKLRKEEMLGAEVPE